jgi:hypothetical protein
VFIGLYPLLPGNICHFLVADFDGPAAMLDAFAYTKAARTGAVPAALEVFQSGRGAHVWVFFTGAVPALVARVAGTVLLHEAMALRGSMDLRSYDRLLPNQDVVPEGGFGNLIAAPLQGRRRKDGADHVPRPRHARAVRRPATTLRCTRYGGYRCAAVFVMHMVVATDVDLAVAPVLLGCQATHWTAREISVCSANPSGRRRLYIAAIPAARAGPANTDSPPSGRRACQTDCLVRGPAWASRYIHFGLRIRRLGVRVPSGAQYQIGIGLRKRRPIAFQDPSTVDSSCS